jgi:ATP-dependent DNA helicase RecG
VFHPHWLCTAYLLADSNGTSIKVAKYKGKDRVNLTENNEYGYCSLIKASKQVLDKLELENKTHSKITPKERENQRLWNPIALREAVINAIIHNDYTNEAPPKFEIFDDRIEITSAGGLPEALSQEEFFEGVSIPRNKELMRIFKDLDLVEHLGSGVPL